MSERTRVRRNFTKEEDEKLINLVKEFGHKWTEIAKHMPGRDQHQCRERYVYYLAPDINRNEWTKEEDALLIAKRNELGNRWTLIAKFLPGRTSLQVRDRLNFLTRHNLNIEKLHQENEAIQSLLANEEKTSLLAKADQAKEKSETLNQTTVNDFSIFDTFDLSI